MVGPLLLLGTLVVGADLTVDGKVTLGIGGDSPALRGDARTAVARLRELLKKAAALSIPLTHKASRDDDLFGGEGLAPGQMPVEEALQLLTPMLEDPAILKIGQNMKYDAKILHRYGLHIAPIDDTMLLSYAMHGGLHGHGMDQLSERYLSHNPIPIKELIGTGVLANCICPAVIETPMINQMTQEQMDYMTAKIPMGRLGTVDEVAALIAWLSSDDCSFSTGAVYDISGGRATY